MLHQLYNSLYGKPAITVSVQWWRSELVSQAETEVVGGLLTVLLKARGIESLVNSNRDLLVNLVLNGLVVLKALTNFERVADRLVLGELVLTTTDNLEGSSSDALFGLFAHGEGSFVGV